VWASGKNRTNAATPLHSNFNLDKAGEYLALVDPNTNVVSEFAPAYPPQNTDVSYGRDRLNPSLVRFFIVPTPLKPNSTEGPGFGPEVKFSRDSGIFTNAFSLTLSSPDNTNAQIRYLIVTTATTAITTNIPTTNSLLYTGSLTITNTCQVRAVAFPTNAGA